MHHWKHLVAALLVSAAPLAPAYAQSSDDPPSTVLTGADLFNFAVAADPQISPDGRQIAYTRLTADPLKDRMTSTIWLIDVATGQQRPLIAGTGGPSSPRWSPDGKRLAYVSGADGGSPQLFVRWMDRGDSVRVTGLPDSPSDMAWSPDGRRIAYVMRVPGDEPKLGTAPAKPEGATWAPPLQVIDKVTYRADGAGYLQAGFDHIFLVDADGGAPRRLTSGSFNHEGPLSWTPEGRTLLFSANLKPDWELNALDSEIYALPVDGGQPVALTHRNGPDQGPRVSPDGRLIAFTGYDDHGKGFEQAHLYVMNRDGSGVRELAPSLDRNIDSLDWAGGRLVAGYEEAGGYKVSRIGLDGRVSPLASGAVGAGLDRPYAGGSWSVARDGTVAFTSGNALSPADVSVARGGNARRLTRLNELWLGGKRLGEVRAFTARAPDGGSVPSWLVLPPTYQPGTKVPLILEIHGGPYSSYGPNFSTDDQLYAAAGYAVLYTNPRGSTGYGQAFADGIEKTYPASDFDDLMAAVDGAIAQGVADPDNLFVTGGSGGGILTAWIVGKTNRFRAAAAQKPVINWTSMALTADGVPFFAKYWMGKLPWQDPQGYWARSPLGLVGNVKTPTLVVVGSEDYRTPVSEAEQYYAALKLAGVPTTLVKVPGASHGGLASRPSQSAAKASAILAWFDRYRKG
ncbi:MULTISPECIES: S9 family peptidase [Sphingomonas]|uniref:S9 family peptidase n=1 Tax=Sphingomonas TaxID=13687 RepID=UPI000DEED415|nr:MULTISPECIES: S9 family peptidase [Sphingomonas]